MDGIAKIVEELRARVVAAEARGQVELHLDIELVDLLVTMAEVVVQARRG